MREVRALVVGLLILSACSSGGADCEAEFTPFLESLHELDSRLDIGLNVGEYGDKVGDLKVAYDKIQVKELPQDCVTKVGVPTEAALNEYIEALNAWQDCVQTSGCETSFIESNLRGFWTAASDKIAEADKGLASL